MTSTEISAKIKNRKVNNLNTDINYLCCFTWSSPDSFMKFCYQIILWKKTKDSWPKNIASPQIEISTVLLLYLLRNTEKSGSRLFPKARAKTWGPCFNFHQNFSQCCLWIIKKKWFMCIYGWPWTERIYNISVKFIWHWIILYL